MVSTSPGPKSILKTRLASYRPTIPAIPCCSPNATPVLGYGPHLLYELENLSPGSHTLNTVLERLLLTVICSRPRPSFATEICLYPHCVPIATVPSQTFYIKG